MWNSFYLFVGFIGGAICYEQDFHNLRSPESGPNALERTIAMIRALAPGHEELSLKGPNGEVLIPSEMKVETTVIRLEGSQTPEAIGCTSGPITETSKSPGPTTTSATFYYSPYTSTSTTLCAYMTADLGVININSESSSSTTATTASIPITSFGGTNSCENCYANVGANLVFYTSCHISLTSAKCVEYFSESGGINFNAAIVLNDASVTTAGEVLLYQAPSNITLFYYPASTTEPGFEVVVFPSLYLGYGGTLTSTGTATLTASLSTTAGVSFEANVTSGLFSSGFSSDLEAEGSFSLTPPSITSQLSALDMKNFYLSVIPVVTWNITSFFGDTSTGYTTPQAAGYSTGVNLTTSFAATYTFNETLLSPTTTETTAPSPFPTVVPTSSRRLQDTPDSPTLSPTLAPCSSAFSLGGTATFNSIFGYYILGVSKENFEFPVGISDTATLSAPSQSSQCFDAVSSPGTSPPGTSPSSNGKLSGGAIAGIVIASVAVAGGAVAAAYVLYVRSLSSTALASKAAV